MKQITLKFLFILSLISITALSQTLAQELSTKHHGIVCKMDDITETNYFVDLGTTWDQTTGRLSSKVIEMPTKNAYAYNNKKFQVKLVSVSRARCLGCEYTQEIQFISQIGASDIIYKLAISNNQAIVTGFDLKGKPLPYPVIAKGICSINTN